MNSNKWASFAKVSPPRFVRKSGGRRAFSLAELLACLAVTMVITGVLLSALAAAARHTEYLADRRKAVNRIAAVEAFLRWPAAYCGFGVPLEPERYRAAFGGLPHEPFNWPGPVSAGTADQRLTDSGDRRADNALFITYIQRSSCRAAALTTLDGTNDAMPLDRQPGAREVEKINPLRPNCKSFVCFGSALPPGTPLRVTSVEKSDFQLRHENGSSVVVLKDDRMWLFRAMTLFASGGRLYSLDYSGSGKQPRLNGICDLRFRVDTDAGKLTVYIMARGDKKYGGKPPGKGITEWPEEYRSDTFKNRENYLLVTEKIVLDLPNCRSSGIFGKENAVEAF